jgi:tRNA threonylcarbamoyladenosine biosynthesis protein TsaB
MVVLGMDTSRWVRSLALVRGDEVIAEWTAAPTEKYRDTLILQIDYLLQQSGLRVSDVERVAVGIGPGGFTGVRLGVCTAKGWALGAAVQVVGVSSLLALAYPWLSCGLPVVALTDAFKNEVYVAAYAANGLGDGQGCQTLLAPAHGSATTVCQALQSVLGEGRYVVVGDGFRRYESEWSPEFVRRALVVAKTFDAPRGASVAMLGARASAQADVAALTAAALEPAYVRQADVT